MRKNEEILQVAENATKKSVAFSLTTGLHYQSMRRAKKMEKPKPIQLRPTADDYAIIAAGMRKHGVDRAQILRMALRRFAEAEKLELQAS